MRDHRFRTAFLAAAVVILVVAGPRDTRAGSLTYLALGDSLAFGVGADDTAADVSNGDRGYTGPYATLLGTVQGGVRPDLIDLGVSGETTTSFFQGGGGIGGPASPLRNTNYGNTPAIQNDLMQSEIGAEKLLGHTISTVSVQLGANDLYQVVGTPGFFNLPPEQQQALFLQALATIQANYTHLLGELRTQLPSAQLVLMGYYDPYAAFLGDPTSPLYAIAQASHAAIPALNQVIEGEASAFGGVYIDEYSAIAGHELAYTYVASGNSHPNSVGYAAITNQLALATVPEPGSFGLALVGFIVVGLVGRGRRRRRAADVPDRRSGA
jgi:lysophospholipase L1-like esterase